LSCLAEKKGLRVDYPSNDWLLSSSEQVLTVSELAARARLLLEEQFPLVRVVGEVSDRSVAGSGHVYFSLKDDRATFPSVMFRTAVARIGGIFPEDGTEVEALGRVTLYEPRGRTQLLVEWLTPRGEGALGLELLQLRNKLQAEGLFDPAKKRPLPTLPKLVGIVTSLQGAVLHDMLRVMGWRFPAIPILIYPVRVQGLGAAAEIASAVKRMGDGRHGDVLIVARGGGSAEDLSAFNDESVVRAVAASRVPVVSAVGHETDVVLCDWAADARAPTPTAAAELVAPDAQVLRQRVVERQQQLGRLLQLLLEKDRRRLLELAGSLRDPRLVLAKHRMRLDEMRLRMLGQLNRKMQQERNRFSRIQVRLASLHPRQRLKQERWRSQNLQARLRELAVHQIEQRRLRLQGAAQALSNLNPLAVLSRGYGLVIGPKGNVLRSSKEVSSGDPISVRLYKGSLDATVIRAHQPLTEPVGGWEDSSHGKEQPEDQKPQKE
jgi:exodeoxyribonuclease VII large subunit